MKKLGSAFLVLIAGLLSGLALVASAAGTTTTHVPAGQAPPGSPSGRSPSTERRIAYDASSRYVASPHAPNKVLVWNLRTGKTIKVSGVKTAAADSTSTGAGVFQLALAGTRVAWLLNVGGNLEGDDYLFTSSTTQAARAPGRERDSHRRRLPRPQLLAVRRAVARRSRRLGEPHRRQPLDDRRQRRRHRRPARRAQRYQAEAGRDRRGHRPGGHRRQQDAWRCCTPTEASPCTPPPASCC